MRSLMRGSALIRNLFLYYVLNCFYYDVHAKKRDHAHLRPGKAGGGLPRRALVRTRGGSVAPLCADFLTVRLTVRRESRPIGYPSVKSEG